MPDEKKDTVTFTITCSIEEYRRLREMMELEKLESIGEVYNKALNRNYDFLKRQEKLHDAVGNMNHHYKRNQN